MEILHQLHPGGVFLRAEALQHGYADEDLVRALRAGVIARVRHGAYVAAESWKAADPIGQHALRARAVMLRHGDRVALSHVSGAVVHGLRVWGSELSRVHITRLDGLHTRRITDVAHHMGSQYDGDLEDIDGMHVLSPARCAVGTAMTNSVEAGLVTVDSAYDSFAVTDADLLGAASVMAGWPGARRLQVTLRLARPGSESVGETRFRYLCRTMRVPSPELQYPIRDARGALIGYSDFAWPEHRLLAEFDGRVKYEHFLRQGESPGDAVLREKVREDRIREATGWTILRFVWNDLGRPAETARRLRRHMHGLEAA
ncbi:MAG: type IV toxin-antitoxin system AbiEi family antitoxin domain-containing protein [Marmoricola sp.]